MRILFYNKKRLVNDKTLFEWPLFQKRWRFSNKIDSGFKEISGKIHTNIVTHL